ncbi:MAG: ComEC family competence protein [Rhodospirillales bacterium]|nr:ComEC family competence protein [Rhodospirillales bacterium]
MDARVKSAHDDKGAVRESPAMLIRALPERALATIVAEERDRLALWLPVLVGAGIGAYFTLTREPPLWLGLVALVAAASIGWLGRRRPGVLVAAMAAAALALGFAATQWRAATVAAPILEKRIGPTSLVARVVSIDRFPAARRVTFDRPRIAGLGPERTPATVRVTFRGHEPPLKPGQWVQARVSLLPPPAPAAPGAFDFQRQAFFQCLGAVGFGLGVPQVTAEGAEEGWDRFTLGLERLRQNITERVLEGLDGERGAIAAAFITGERAAISEELMNAMRDSGLAHLLAVSGMNISLIAGILFVCVRAGLALIPPIALRYPIKKWAAVAAIPGAFAYALIAGATVPTQRAVLMITLVLIGVLVDRQAISMRLCAWAAAAILLTTPETVLGASFQMSFAAVVALVAVYEVFRMRGRFDVDAPRGWARAAAYYLGAVALTTFVASAATTPFAVYHFNRFAVYGLLANMIAVPATSLWVMPWVVPVFVLLPFGLEGWALVPMGWGIDVVNWTARWVAGLPGAATVIPSMPMAALAVVTLGGLWLCLWRQRWRLAGVPAIALGLASLAFVEPPHILIDGEGKLLAVRTEAGGLSLSSAKARRLNRETWLRRAGLEEPAPAWPADGTSADGRLACDAQGCLYRDHGRTVALVKHAAALPEDCRVAEVVVSVVPVRKSCPGPRVVIDRFDLWRNGAHALWLSPAGVRIESVNGERGARPWVVRPAAKDRGDS